MEPDLFIQYSGNICLELLGRDINDFLYSEYIDINRVEYLCQC